ncbi:GNAT family N-acetyltransferase [Chitinophaga qingshengii]|uniref:GNAT family N-acetyltransferase n=1 Tax=Chitinophaga qingshengii TaxID=1569794 RepID=A0ABR7TUL6_9BACT|nr:GNAT family N-acetyltransferase [Chitinophaga qingshengii]MBC9934171.1 GNAT family N-acetyltransferase [Chitinophaga qingshengii]
MRFIYQDEKIIIREFKSEEGILFTGLFKDPEVTRYLPYRSPEQYEELFQIVLDTNHHNIFNRWGVWDVVTNDFIGCCLARPFVEVPGQVEIGYTLAQAFWGKGIGTIISKALVDYCFRHHGAQEIAALTDLDNIGSQKVLEKTGFVRQANLVREDRELAYFVMERPA